MSLRYRPVADMLIQCIWPVRLGASHGPQWWNGSRCMHVRVHARIHKGVIMPKDAEGFCESKKRGREEATRCRQVWIFIFFFYCSIFLYLGLTFKFQSLKTSLGFAYLVLFFSFSEGDAEVRNRGGGVNLYAITSVNGFITLAWGEGEVERKSALCYGAINIQSFPDGSRSAPYRLPSLLPLCGSICVSCINHPSGHDFAQLERVAAGVRARAACWLHDSEPGSGSEPRVLSNPACVCGLARMTRLHTALP